MRKRQPGQGRSYLLLVAVGAVVLAFMGLSLAVTATGTARFAVAMGYRGRADQRFDRLRFEFQP